MGIKYNDSIMVYNKYTEGLMQKEYYIGTEIKNVRVEMTEATNRNKSGLTNADRYVVKIPKSALPKPYIEKDKWDLLTDKTVKITFSKDDFIVITKKEELNIEEFLPSGLVESEDYTNGFFNYVKTFTNAFQIGSVDIFQLIPRFQISGS